MTNKGKIAYQGMPGANSHIACSETFPEYEPMPCESFEEAFDAVRRGEAQLAMIPVDNTVAGRVADVHHLMPNCGLHIVAEHFLRINFHLMAVPGTRLEEVETVHSHIHALGQTRKFQRRHAFKSRVAADTAGAARDIAKRGDKRHAAIAPKMAASIYGLDILVSDIEDAEHNTTRFLILAPEPSEIGPDPGKVLTSFLFEVRNVPAALYKAMGGFATNGINMVKLESYIDPSFSQARFYADVIGHPDEYALKLAMEELGFFAVRVELLGVYPVSPLRAKIAAAPHR